MDPFLLSDIFPPGVRAGGGGQREAEMEEGQRGGRRGGERARASRQSASPIPVLFSLIGPGGGEEIGQRLDRASRAAFNWLLFFFFL